MKDPTWNSRPEFTGTSRVGGKVWGLVVSEVLTDTPTSVGRSPLPPQCGPMSHERDAPGEPGKTEGSWKSGRGESEVGKRPTVAGGYGGVEVGSGSEISKDGSREAVDEPPPNPGSCTGLQETTTTKIRLQGSRRATRVRDRKRRSSVSRAHRRVSVCTRIRDLNLECLASGTTLLTSSRFSFWSSCPLPPFTLHPVLRCPLDPGPSGLNPDKE